MNSLLTTLVLAAVGQNTTDAGGLGSSSAAVQVQSIWDFAVKGGPMMIPIGLCSLIALTVIIERTISLRRASIIPSSFLAGLKKILGNGDHVGIGPNSVCYSFGHKVRMSIYNLPYSLLDTFSRLAEDVIAGANPIVEIIVASFNLKPYLYRCEQLTPVT